MKKNGTLYCWGDGGVGQLGHGDEWKEEPTLVQLPQLP